MQEANVFFKKCLLAPIHLLMLSHIRDNVITCDFILQIHINHLNVSGLWCCYRPLAVIKKNCETDSPLCFICRKRIRNKSLVSNHSFLSLLLCCTNPWNSSGTPLKLLAKESSKISNLTWFLYELVHIYPIVGRSFLLACEVPFCSLLKCVQNNNWICSDCGAAGLEEKYYIRPKILKHLWC